MLWALDHSQRHKASTCMFGTTLQNKPRIISPRSNTIDIGIVFEKGKERHLPTCIQRKQAEWTLQNGMKGYQRHEEHYLKQDNSRSFKITSPGMNQAISKQQNNHHSGVIQPKK